MQYFGGKQRISKELVQIIEKYQQSYTHFLEPFVGGCNIIPEINMRYKFAYDKNEYLIEMYKSLQKGWMPPQNISEEQYNYIKQNQNENKALTGFVGIACSYSGKWFGGYARNKTGRNYCLNGYNSLQKLILKIKKIHFVCQDYRELHPINWLVYCDPPYDKTAQYDATGKFDSNEFWNIMRIWSEKNTVLISEYNAPEDFICVWQKETKLDIKNKNGEKERRVEKLFKMVIK